MMPGKRSNFTPPILNFCPCWFQNSFGFFVVALTKKKGVDLKNILCHFLPLIFFVKAFSSIYDNFFLNKFFFL